MPIEKRRGIDRAVGAASVIVLVGAAAHAAEPEKNNSQPSGIPDPSIATSLPQNGDPNGALAWLASRGVTYGFSYYGEVMANPSGGFSQGSIYDGRAKIVVDVDLAKSSAGRA